MVPQVDERQVLAVLTTTGHPTTDRHASADVGGTERSAMVGAHGKRIGHWSSSGIGVESERRLAIEATTDSRPTVCCG